MAYSGASAFNWEGTKADGARTIESHAYYRCEVKRDGKFVSEDTFNVASFPARPDGSCVDCTADYENYFSATHERKGIFAACSSLAGADRRLAIDTLCSSVKPTATSSITGTVSSPSGKLEGARVAALNADGHLVGVAWSDASGVFNVEGLQSDAAYALAVSRDGYTKHTVASATAGDSEIDVQLEKSVDLNADGVVNMSDVVLLAAHFNTAEGDPKYDQQFDLNEDGAINMRDVVLIAAKFNTTIPR